MTIQQTADLIEREREWVASFMKHGLPYMAACAFTGNFVQENMGRPVTDGKLDHESQGGGQWRLDRLDSTGHAPKKGIPPPYGLYDWTKANGLDWKTIDAQAQFTIWECKQFYPSLFAECLSPNMTVKDPLATLTANIQDQYEIPAKESAELDNRIDAAKYCFDNFHDLETAPSPAPAPAPKPAPVPAPGPAPAPAPAPVAQSDLAKLIAAWRVRKTEADAANKALDDAKTAIVAEIAKRQEEIDASKKEIQMETTT